MQIVRQDLGQRPSSAVRGVDEQDDGGEPRWTDRDLAVLIELAHSSGWHRRRLGLPEDDGGLSFVERCWRRLAWLRTCSIGGDLWAGIDEPGDLEQMRGLPPELRHLRRPRGAA